MKKRSILFGCLVLSLAWAILQSTVFAQNTWTNAAGGSWETGSNWSSGTSPSGGDVLFNLPSSYLVTLNGNTTNIRDFTVVNSDLSFTLNGNTLSIRDLPLNSNSSEVLFSNGVVQIGNGTGQATEIIWGDQATDNSTLDLFNTDFSYTTTSSKNLMLGRSGQATMKVRGGSTATVDILQTGWFNSGNIEVNGSSSLLAINNYFELGAFGNGTLDITNGGTVQVFQQPVGASTSLQSGLGMKGATSFAVPHHFRTESEPKSHAAIIGACSAS